MSNEVQEQLDGWLDRHEACYENLYEDEEGYFIYLDPKKGERFNIKIYLPTKFNQFIL